MIVFDKGKTSSLYFNNILDYLQAEDVLVFNDVKVIKAKIFATIVKNGKNVEFNLDRQIFEEEATQLDLGNLSTKVYWMAICKGSKKISDFDLVKVADDFDFLVERKLEDGFCIISCEVEGFFDKLQKYGKVPLPPYIKRQEGSVSGDEGDYQTIYAKNGAGVAAPTAGLHFDEEIFAKIEEIGVKKAFVTLNVGAGTFLPVRTDSILDHKMHEEYYEITTEAVEIINSAKEKGGRVIAVGTTSLRVLESSCDGSGKVFASTRKTDIFIYPGYEFKIIDGLLTNFHLPKSTLFMLVCAFIASDNAKKLYKQAIQEEYRFFSYGDCCLLLP